MSDNLPKNAYSSPLYNTVARVALVIGMGTGTVSFLAGCNSKPSPDSAQDNVKLELSADGRDTMLDMYWQIKGGQVSEEKFRTRFLDRTERPPEQAEQMYRAIVAYGDDMDAVVQAGTDNITNATLARLESAGKQLDPFKDIRFPLTPAATVLKLTVPQERSRALETAIAQDHLLGSELSEKKYGRDALASLAIKGQEKRLDVMPPEAALFEDGVGIGARSWLNALSLEANAATILLKAGTGEGNKQAAAQSSGLESAQSRTLHERQTFDFISEVAEQTLRRHEHRPPLVPSRPQKGPMAGST